MSLDDFPLEIIWQIGQYLPFRDIQSFRVTCSSFNDLFRDIITRKLLPHQVSHYDRMKASLLANGCAVDTSLMGSGKTYVACALAAQLRLSLTIFCPKSVAPVWENVAPIFGIDNIVIQTYAFLRKDNRYFRRVPDSSPLITDEFHQRMQQGTLLIFDESQALKNKSCQFIGARCLTRAIQTLGGRSRLLFLTATPIDKEEQVAHFCQLLGIIQNDRLARQDIQEGYVFEGIQDLLNYCQQIAPREDWRQIRSNINNINKHRQMLKLFTTYIKPRLCFAMSAPQIDSPLDIKNGYYEISGEGNTHLAEGLHQLTQAIRSRLLTNPTDNEIDWGGVSRALQKIEFAKVEILVRLSHEILRQPGTKVVCMLSYTEPLAMTFGALSQYQPLKLNGKTSSDQRKEIVRLFQTSPTHRVLVANLSVAALGLSLHDTTGQSPRTLLVIPNYYVMNLHQATRRIYREGTKSPATVRFIYAKSHIQESRLLDAISRKSKVIKELLDERLKDVKYPSEYETYIEGQ
jgi:hypothetical protein